MTFFEIFATEVIGKVEKDGRGFYTGKTKALAQMTNEVILSDNDEIADLSWEAQQEIIKKNFYKVFPYMNK